MSLNNTIHQRFFVAGASLVLVLLAFLAYWPGMENDFVPFDDVIYVLENPPVLKGLTWESFVWAFGTFHGGNWHPLTWLSHMLDVTLYGLAPWGHHLSGVLVHLLNTLLLFFALRSLSGALWRSFAVAALFTLHPLHVESVAWIAERKDVLCTLFWFAALWAYAGYVRAPSVWRYLLVVLLFAMGLMAKSMIVTLPITLLLLDLWPLNRVRIPWGERTDKQRSMSKLFVEKIPLFVMSLAIGVTTMFAQKQYNALNTLDVLGPGMRLYNALRAYVAYLGQTFYPKGLAILYPYPDSVVVWKAGLCVALLAAVTAWSLLSMRRRPWLSVGWLWYVATLAPVIGIMQVGIQSMADRYTYVPLVGIFIALVWSAAEIGRRYQWGGIVCCGLLAVVLAMLAPLTREQVRVWKDGESLLGHAVNVVPNHYEAQYNLGGVYYTRGDMEAAAEHLEPYVRARPGNAQAAQMLSEALFATGQFEKLPVYLELALRHRPEAPPLLAAKGVMLQMRGRHEEAVAALQASLKKDPGQARVRSLLGLSLSTMGRLSEAGKEFRRALKDAPSREDRMMISALIRDNLRSQVKYCEDHGRKKDAAKLRELYKSLPLQ